MVGNRSLLTRARDLSFASSTHEEEVPARRELQRDFLLRVWGLGRVHLTVRSDDAELLHEIAATFGHPGADEGSSVAALDVTVTSGGADADHGLIEFETDDLDALTPADMLLGLSSATFPFTQVAGPTEDAIAFALEGDREPLFSFSGTRCVFWKRDRWRAAVAFLLIHRVYRLRRDAIFFHAASVALNGSGVMLIGPKGAGKSTTSLALAARGVPLLGDEIACWLPETGMIEPFLRPVGVKPGPRCEAVTAALHGIGRVPDQEVVRIDADRFLTLAPPASVPLRAVIFLAPFAEQPSLRRLEGGRDQIGAMQPVTSSLVNAPRGRRVLELARLIATTTILELSPGTPDDTADYLIRDLGEYLA